MDRALRRYAYRLAGALLAAGLGPARATQWQRLGEGMRTASRLAAIRRSQALPHLAAGLLSSGCRYDLARQGLQP